MKESEIKRRARLKRRYEESVERSIAYYNHLNQIQPVTYRHLSEDEIKQITEKHEDCHKLKVKTVKGEIIMSTINILIDSISKVKEFNSLAVKFPCEIDIVSGRYIIDGRSLMGLFSLDLGKPVEMKFDKKYEDLAKLLFSKFEVKE